MSQHFSKNTIAVVFGLMILSLESCFEPPVYPNVPDISYQNIRFVELEGPDSLILSFNFQDGDGDIGLLNEETFPPFHQYNLVIDSTARFRYDEQLGDSVVETETVRFVEFGDEGASSPYYLVSNFGTLIGTYSQEDIQLPNYSCRDYLFVTDLDADTLGSDKTDTILIEQNIFLNNIIIKFLRKRNGQLQDITNSFSPDACTPPFNSRIPVFDGDNIGRPLDGVINYPMISSGFLSNFLNDSIIVEFYIYDRALNKSNVVQTPAFTLPGLLGLN